MFLRTLFFVTISSFVCNFVQADETWRVSPGAPLPLSETGQNLSTDYYQVEQWGIFQMSNSLWHEEWLYPTANDVNPEGVFIVDANKIGVGDLDGDGDQDVVISWSVFPHVVHHPKIAPTILINTDGQLALAPEEFLDGAMPERIFAYKVGISDFNLDGRDDVVLASSGVHLRNSDGTIAPTFEPIPLMLSSANGIRDASAQISGQENGGLPGTFEWAHDLAVGDLSGDGIADFYQGKHLFVGDGAGNFSVRNDLLPVDASVEGITFTYVMSSAIGDLDNDGVNDLVVALADGQNPATAVSGWIFLSAGSGSIKGGTQQQLPAGLYGLTNTKHNSLQLGDINNDGRLDILIGQTQAAPYYNGRSLQLLVNQGGGSFLDETSERLQAGIRPDSQGEGMLRILDINGDGHLDIVDQAGSKPDSVAILVNDGTGVFSRMPTSELPILQDYHIAEYASWEGEEWGASLTPYLFPIDLNGNGIVSFLVQLNWPLLHWPLVQGDSNQSTYYILSPKKAYAPVSGPKRANDSNCIMNWVENSFAEYFPAPETSTGLQEGFDYRYYESTNSYLAVRGRTLFALVPALGGLIDGGMLDKYLPDARASGC
jgi:hypothetical protein